MLVTRPKPSFLGKILELKYHANLFVLSLTISYYSGTIDEVNQEVNMTWVQPRVLEFNQVCFVHITVNIHMMWWLLGQAEMCVKVLYNGSL